MLKTKSPVTSSVVWLLTTLQILFPVASFAASGHTTEAPESFALSEPLTTAAQNLSSQSNAPLKSTAKTLATGATASTAQEWLNQFGTARIQLNVDDNGDWGDSSFDYLQPIFDNKKLTLFAQLGLRAPDGRFTSNTGLGVRTYYVNDWMFGANVFFDHDYEGKNSRVGIGGEAWTNNFKLSANGYVGTTDWHRSRDFDNYDEKPADGFDVRAEGYLPAYPQLGASVMYEKYYGDDVALFDKDHLQSNPSAVTVGVSYTPVPLVTAGIDYKRGQDSLDEVHFSLNLRYQLGESWQSQISPDQVALRRSLAGSRYDLVERNNTIVMQYKKQAQTEEGLADMTLSVVQNSSPADGKTANQVSVHAVTTSGQPAKNTAVSWSVTGNGKLSAASSVTDSNGNAQVSITDTTAEAVTVTATAGSLIRTTTSTFATSSATLSLEQTKDNSLANGVDQNQGLVTVKDSNGNALSGVALSWKVNNGATIVQSDSKTDSHGQGRISLTSTSAGPVTVSVSSQNESASMASHFTAAQVASVTVTMSSNNQPADGTTPAVAKAQVLDSNGKPMKDVSVNWAATGSAIAKSPTTVTTDAQGEATFSLADSVIETVVVTAQAGGQTGHSSAVFTTSDSKVATIALTATGSGSQSDPVRYTAVARNTAGETVPGAHVVWSGGIVENPSIICNTGDSTTNGSGKASKSCYNSTATLITNVTTNIVVAPTDVVHPAIEVTDGVTQDFAPTP